MATREALMRQAAGVFNQLYVGNCRDGELPCLEGREMAIQVLFDILVDFDARVERIERVLNIHEVKED